jgi:hypothetical protein
VVPASPGRQHRRRPRGGLPGVSAHRRQHGLHPGPEPRDVRLQRGPLRQLIQRAGRSDGIAGAQLDLAELRHAFSPGIRGRQT